MKSIVFFFCCTLLFSASVLAGEVNLSAAVSLKDVLTEPTDAFAKKEPAATFHTNFGASGTLTKQTFLKYGFIDK
jgi:ABC-type molybdate transport system substrate-binding protein